MKILKSVAGRAALLAMSTSVAVAATVAVSADPAVAATGAAPGSYVALAAQSRVVDTRSGAGGNHKGAVKAGRTITVRVAGVGAVPRSGVGSVVLTVTASSPTGTGALTLYGGARPRTTNLQFAAGQAPVTNTAVVRLSSGRMHIANTARRGSVQVAVDVSGYYRSGTASGKDPGTFHALGTASRVATLQPHAGASVTTPIGGRGGVPAGAGAAAVTLTVWGATSAGTVLAHRPDEPRQNLPLVRFAAGQAVSAFAVVRLSGGKTTLVNTSSHPVRLSVDVAGWYVLGFAQAANTFQTLVPTQVVHTTIGAGATMTAKLGGRGGVPLAGVRAVLVTVHALRPTGSGGLQAWRPGVSRPRSSTVVQFGSGRSATNVALLPVTSDGRVALHNTARGRTGLELDVDGYVPARTLNPPAVSNGRYLSDLTGDPTADPKRMQTDGCVDGQSGSRFVLLDLGAQSVSGQLAGHPGVSLAKTAITVRYTYAELQGLIGTYMTSFASCSGGTTAVLAVGTNNDGDWDSTSPTYYAPAKRGHDWANFIDNLDAAAPSGITVVGAADIEPGFASTQAQAATWKQRYLANTTAELIFTGSADGCPVTWTVGATCAFGWTQRQLYALAAGSRTRALPQIYYGFMATQWAMIDARGGGKMRFVGPLVQAKLTNVLSAGQSWVALSRAIASVTATPVPRTVVKLYG